MVGQSNTPPPTSFRLLVPLLTLAVLFACEKEPGPLQPEPVPVPSFALLTYDCLVQAGIPATECQALVSLYESTNGDAWVRNQGWLSAANPCDWHGVTCLGGSVARLELQNNALSGPIPPELEGLGGLEVLDLFGNRLTGSIPPQMGNLSSLEVLNLTYNQITGPLPSALGDLGNLRVLFAFGNQLSGPIPPELGRLSNLLHLSFGANRLTGSIPPEIGNLDALSELNLRYNRLSGEIPPELGNLSRLGTRPSSGLALDGNNLSGLLPVEVARMGGEIERRGPGKCFLVPPGNHGLYMPDVPTFRINDWDTDGLICGLRFTADASTVADDIRTIVDELYATGVLNQGQAIGLIRKIDHALDLLAKGKNAEAIVVLQNFNQQVNDLTYVDFVLIPAQADALITRAQIMIQLI